MVYPVNIQFGSVVIPSHLVCELLAYSLGYRYFIYLRKKSSDLISSDDRTLIFIAAAAGAFVFSRLVGAFENPDLFLNRIDISTLYGNKTILGGLLGGLLAVEICKKIIGVKSSSGDLMTYPLILAMLIGRLGCHLAGLEDGTFGTASQLPWSIDFGDHIFRHPTNLYEMLFLALLWLSLLALERATQLADGTRFKLFLFSYCVFRFLIEFIKPKFMLLFDCSSIQIAALLGVFYYTYLFIKSRIPIKKNIYA